MQALEVGNLRLVASLHQRLEAIHHELGGTTAENSLLTEQIGLGLLGERGLDTAGAKAADALGIRKSQRPCAASGVLLHSHDHRHAATSSVLTTNEMAWALWSNHDDVDIGRWLDVAEADVEAVTENEGLTR